MKRLLIATALAGGLLAAVPASQAADFGVRVSVGSGGYVQPAAYRYQRGILTPYQVQRIVWQAGYRDIDSIVRANTLYFVRAETLRGAEVRLTIHAFTGRIIDRDFVGRGWQRGPARVRLSEQVLFGHMSRAGYRANGGFRFDRDRYSGYGFDRSGNSVRLELDAYSGRVVVATRVQSHHR